LHIFQYLAPPWRERPFFFHKKYCGLRNGVCHKTATDFGEKYCGLEEAALDRLSCAAVTILSPRDPMAHLGLLCSALNTMLMSICRSVRN